MNRLDRYFALLELPPGVSPQEIRRAYRDLVRVWHPDRFPHEPRLQHRAQEKLKDLNEAYAVLMSSPHIPQRSRSAPVTPPQGTGFGGKTAQEPYGGVHLTPPIIPDIFKWLRKFGGLLSPLLLGGLLLLFIAYVAGSPQSVMNLIGHLKHSPAITNYFSFILVI